MRNETLCAHARQERAAVLLRGQLADEQGASETLLAEITVLRNRVHDSEAGRLALEAQLWTVEARLVGNLLLSHDGQLQRGLGL